MPARELLFGHWTRVAVALVAISGSGLGMGWLLQQYDEHLAFRWEADRIAEVLGVKEGMIVGDIRAGTGRWTADLARRVGVTGQVYATAGPHPPHVLYDTLAEADVDNVTVITKTPGNMGRLPVGCCDAILMRVVYHHFVDRPSFSNTLFKDLRPGGRLVIIDFDEGTPEYESGHGIGRQTVKEELTGAGFRLEQSIEDWEGDAYCLVFRKPQDEPQAPL